MRHAVLKTEQEHVDQALELLAAVVEGEALAAAPDLDEVDRIKAQTRASSARARLHVLTGGWFPLR